jgi:hypothetical protein
MTEADVAQLGKADELGDGLANFRVKYAQPGMEQQWFVVFHQKMVELEIAPLSKDRDAIEIWRDFRDDCHAGLLVRTFLAAPLFILISRPPMSALDRIAADGNGDVQKEIWAGEDD